MKIKRLKIKNFKLIEEQEFIVNSSPLFILDGPNGFGKTTLFDALELLFTGEIRRIKENANELEIKTQNFKDILIWNVKQLGDIEIRCELSDDSRNINLVRHVSETELKAIISDKKKTIATNFNYFQLYQVENYEDEITKGRQISQKQLQDLFGKYFQETYHLFSYIEQEDNLNILKKNHKDRKNLIDHLLNIEEIQKNKKKFDEILKTLATLSKKKEDERNSKEKTFNDIQTKISNARKEEIPYKKVFKNRNDLYWDNENPNIIELDVEIDNINKIISLLKNKKVYQEYLNSNDNNAKIDNILSEKKDVLEGILFYSNFDSKYTEFETINKKRNQLLYWQKALKEEPFSDNISYKDILVDLDKLEWQTEIEHLLAARHLQKEKEEDFSEQHRKVASLRIQLVELHNEMNVEHNDECPLCGHDWETNGALEKAISKKTTDLETKKSKVSIEIEKLEKEFSDKFINEILLLISNILNSEELSLDYKFFEQLKTYHSLRHLIIQIEKKIISLGIDLIGLKFTHREKISQFEMNKKLSDLEEMLELKKSQVNSNLAVHDEAYKIFFQNKPYELDLISIEDLESKKLYLHFVYYFSKQKELQKLSDEINKLDIQIEKIKRFKDKRVQKICDIYNVKIKDYTDKFLKEIALYFYLYSGRILQNYSGGLGIILDTKDKGKVLFKSKLDTDHDALLNMSSGQLSALVLAFSLCLNRIYSEHSFLFIDDPLQTMDELNMASFVEMLRNEFSDRQIIFSTHETHIARYISYKYGKYNLAVTQKNMKESLYKRSTNKE